MNLKENTLHKDWNDVCFCSFRKCLHFFLFYLFLKLMKITFIFLTIYIYVVFIYLIDRFVVLWEIVFILLLFGCLQNMIRHHCSIDFLGGIFTSLCLVWLLGMIRQFLPSSEVDIIYCSPNKGCFPSGWSHHYAIYS